MKIIQQKTNNKLLSFSVFEFVIVFASTIFAWLYVNLESISINGSIVWYGVLPMIFSAVIVVKGILLNRTEKKLTGKGNLTLNIVNVISIVLVLFIVFASVMNFTILFLLFSNFSGR